MKANQGMDSSNQIEESAAAWLARRDGGAWSDADQRSLTQWLQASTAHRVAFIRLEAAWNQARRLKALGAGAQPGVVPAPSHVVPSSIRTSRVFAIAATLVLSVGLAFWGYQHLSRAESYVTAIGGLASVPMSDGSQVTLNTNSEIHVDVSARERRVELDQGEAFFQVAKDASRPFVVSAGTENIVAVGTQFSVRREAGLLRVIVTEGRVRLERADGKSAELDAGSIAQSTGSGLVIQEKPLSEVEDYLSWRGGFLIFRATTLADAVTEFNRYTVRKIVIEDPAVAQIRIGGNFRSNNVGAFVRLLQDGFGVHAEQRGAEILLTRVGDL